MFDYFRHILESDQRTSELNAFAGKVVGTFCNFVPDEIVIAAGAIPVRLCSGRADMAERSSHVFPLECCSVARACAGSLVTDDPLYRRVDLFVVPGSCDSKRKLAQMIASDRPTIVMGLPADKTSPSGRRMWLDQVKGLAARLEDLTGNRITPASLRAAIDLTNASRDAYRELLALRRRKPPAISGLDAFHVTCASFIDDTARWTRELRSAVLSASASSDGQSGPRLLVTGAPIIHPNLDLVALIEDLGSAIVADEMCSGTQRLYDPVVPREYTLGELVRAVAERALLPATCPCFVDGRDRLNRILEMIDAYAVDGVVYHNLRICSLFDAETPGVKAALEEAGVPMLEIRTDYSATELSQLRVRIEAFLELLGGGRTEDALREPAKPSHV
jgi:benzoyl-CoA reductase/2-hydroxyglutaryl-CoA dehydratase subunit BcrC/BadD/HgdB